MNSAKRSRTPPTQPSLFTDDDTRAAASSPVKDIQTLEAQFEALPPAWRAHLKPFIDSDTYAPLCQFVDGERASGKTVYPADVFRALRLTSPDDVK
ncbi:MAG: uracil-DNA glycosylase, partial [Paraburkholderia hospita]